MTSTSTCVSRRWFRLALVLSSAMAMFAVAAMAGASHASAAVEWRTESVWGPSPLQEGAHGDLQIYIYNSGNTDSGLATVTVKLPPGVKYSGEFAAFGESATPVPVLPCTGTTTVVCKPLSVRSFGLIGLTIGVEVAPGVLGSLPWTVSINGGGAPKPYVETGNVLVDDELYGFGFTPGTFIAKTFDENGNDYTRAGGHPHKAVGKFDINLAASNEDFADKAGGNLDVAGGFPKDIVGDLPPGLVGDITAVERCMWTEFEEGDCPPESQIGISHLRLPPINPNVTAVYNMVPPGDQPAQFAFTVHRWTIVADPFVRADADYSVSLRFRNLPEAIQPPRLSLEIWGTPADPSHDAQRCRTPNVTTMACPVPVSSTAEQKPFLSNPVSCANKVVSKFHLSLWNDPAPNEDFTDPRWRNEDVEAPGLTDCDEVPFDPTISLQPTTRQADSPSGLDVHVHIPRGEDDDPSKVVQAHLKKATATLPEGFGFSSGVADGLGACTPTQIGLTSTPGQVPIRFNNVEPACPAASKIANATVKTPVLHGPLTGEVFLAAQRANPFGSNFAIYVVVREPSILVKLAGKVEPDPVTGQIKVTFDRTPQLPFEDFEMHFFDGPRAALATPITCGTFSSSTDLVPWSAVDPDNPTKEEIETVVDPFTIDSSPAGGCASSESQLPLNMGLNAGSLDPLAGARSPFKIQITRPDANQELDRLEISPPPGFVGSLRGIPYCSEAQIASAIARDSGKAEEASPSCPVASQLGTTNVGAGAGPAPFYAPGKLYLAGPYKGAKLSVVVITPAVAGPFDLGNVVVRSALEINPLTARITASTDSLPRMIEGVPLRIRDIRIDLDRPGWAMNPTNCEAMSVDVTAYGTGGAVSKPSNRYQLSGCEKLGFKPKLSIRFKGGTKRGDHPALVATLSTRDGDANISRAAVTLPRSAFLDQAHIRTICTRVQFAADACPPGATYGFAEATTELLDEPLKGNVILRSSNNKLPDLVGDLRGVADIEAVGRIDSIKGGIRNTFEVVPDAPFDAFTLRMQGGKKGLVINSQNLCAKTHRATVKLTAHNGRTHNFRPKVVATGCGKAKRKGQKKRGAGGGD